MMTTQNVAQLYQGQQMRLLFSSAQRGLVEAIEKKLAEAGILCEVRLCAVEEAARPGSLYKELWIETDPRLQWALSLIAMHCESGRN